MSTRGVLTTHTITMTSSNHKLKLNENPEAAGKRLACPPSGDEVVISGISGRFPSSNDIKEFQENLVNKTDMIGKNRWNLERPEIPARAGHLNNIIKFDAEAVDVSIEHANILNPMTRNLLEVIYEAIYDAGINPYEIQGTKTGVFLTNMSASSQNPPVKHSMSIPKTIYSELSRFTSANLISSILKLIGPSCIMDTGCSTSLQSLEEAYRAIRNGQIDAAIIGGASIDLHSTASLQYSRQGFLSPDGRCKAFDERANGYVRAEAVAAIYIQKKKHAKRIYMEVKHCKTGSDGFTEEGITHPSAIEQERLSSQLYNECSVNPTSVAYVEAHGTGTIVGDIQEGTSIDNVFAKKRDNPLLIGSVKSNMGHAETVAGLCQIAKIVVAVQTGLIPPNLHFEQPRNEIEGIRMKRLKVVAEKAEPLPNDCFVAINSFGLGGSNAHLLLKTYSKEKPYSKNEFTRLVIVSGRTRNAVEILMDSIASNPLNNDLFSLFNDIFKYSIPEHEYRGIAIIHTKNNKIYKNISSCNYIKNKTYLIAGSFSKNLLNIAREIAELHLGKETYQCISDILQIDFEKILATHNENDSLVISLIHLVIVHLMKELRVSFQVVNGCFLGIFAEAYATDILTFKEAVLSAVFAINVKKNLKSEKHDNNRNVITCPLTLDNFKKHFKEINRYNCMKDVVWKYIFEEDLLEEPLCDGKAVFVTFGTSTCNVKEETTFFGALSRMYIEGLNMDINKLYLDVEYPVGRTTPMISPLIKWNHTTDYIAPTFYFEGVFHKVTIVEVNDKKWNFLQGHTIDGKRIFPGAGYIYLVWDALAFKNGLDISKINIVMKDVKFMRATFIPQDRALEFLVTIYGISERFSISESGHKIATGKVSINYQMNNTVTTKFYEDDKTITLNKDDIYKELHLRGYNYQHLFKSVIHCRNDFEEGMIEWKNNWISFIDGICQLYILNIHTRNLLVMTQIEKLSICPKLQSANDCSFYAKYCKETFTITCGGVEIKGINADVVEKSLNNSKPLLEDHKFIANKFSTTIEESVSINLQIALEINDKKKLKIVEIADTAIKHYQPLLPYLVKDIEQNPLTEIDATILTNKAITIPQVFVKNSDLSTITNCYMVIGNRLLQKLDSVFNAVMENGFVLSREPLSLNCDQYDQANILSIHTTPYEQIVLLSKPKPPVAYKALQLTDDFKWIETLQNNIKNDNKVIVYSHDYDSGILGFTNAIRREGLRVRCVFICDKDAPKFGLSHPFYRKQLQMGHAVNVYKNGRWGTYRYLPTKIFETLKSEHCLFSSVRRQNQQSFLWTTGPLNAKITPEAHQKLVCAYYSTLNFKDVLEVNGKLRKSVMIGSIEENIGVGCEYSGTLANGKRVMGINPAGDCISNLIPADEDLMMEVPSNWTLQDAATVPISYATVLYALKRGNAKKQHSILIHAGAGGVGQAAINVCHELGMKIFVTTSNEIKRKFLRNVFPFLKTQHIGCSRDTSFEQLVKRETNGKGVDVLLNSLTESKLDASLRCLKRNGIYLEIQKYDSFINKPLPPELLMNEIEMHGINLEKVFFSNTKSKLIKLLKEGLNQGLIKPLSRKVYGADNVNEAFKFMRTGKHIGKTLIEIRKEQNENSILLPHGVPQYYCHGSTVVTGGLGGFGLELIDWLVNRGCKKIVIAARKRLLSGYESSRLRIWKQKQVEIIIAHDDITTEEGCKTVLQKANNLAPLYSIFHLAAVFRDALFEHQTIESYQKTFSVKAKTLRHLDRITRTFYPNLRDFVIFSSKSSGKSVPGQTNYTYANSTMERICEKRREQGLPAIAIQWAIVGDVGQVMRMEEGVTVIGNKIGALAQSISSCLDVLNDILTSKPIVVSSIVLKNKNCNESCGKSVLNFVADVLGLRDLKKIDKNATLAQLGMDSIVATTIKQTLEREFNLVTSYNELRKQTFRSLEQLQTK